MVMNIATTSQNRVERDLLGIICSYVASFRGAWAAHQQRTRLHTELSQCTDRELADMNLSRADISYLVRNWQPD